MDRTKTLLEMEIPDLYEEVEGSLTAGSPLNAQVYATLALVKTMSHVDRHLMEVVGKLDGIEKRTGQIASGTGGIERAIGGVVGIIDEVGSRAASRR